MFPFDWERAGVPNYDRALVQLVGGVGAFIWNDVLFDCFANFVDEAVVGCGRFGFLRYLVRWELGTIVGVLFCVRYQGWCAGLSTVRGLPLLSSTPFSGYLFRLRWD